MYRRAMYRMAMYGQGMREATYYLLLSLVDGPLYGYAIAKRVEELSENRITMTAGTLYGALDRLVKQGHVVVDREEVVAYAGCSIGRTISQWVTNFAGVIMSHHLTFSSSFAHIQWL